jgi:diguanylate cyclase (GGDEF)-like protein/PAS domain S-box-containing protein
MDVLPEHSDPEASRLPLPADWLAPYTALLDAALEAACLVDAHTLRLLAVNTAAGNLLGEDPQSLLGRQVTALALAPEDVVFWNEIQAAQATAPLGAASRVHSESWVHNADGLRTVERCVQRLPMDNGRVVYFWGMLDHSARYASEEKLERLLSEMQATLEATADGILVTDLNGTIQAFNRLFSQQWGMPAHLLDSSGTAIYHFMRAQVQDTGLFDQRMAVIIGDALLENRDKVTLLGGRVLECVTLPQMSRGEPIGRVYSFRDITDRLFSEDRLRLAAEVFESSIDAIFVVDAEHCIFTANQSCSRLMEHRADELQGKPLTALLSMPQKPNGLALILQGLPVKNRWEGELHYLRADGTVTPLQVSLVHLEGKNGTPMHCIGHAHDLTETIADKQRIHDLAFRDALTGLPNRIVLNERVGHAIAIAKRDQHGFAIMFIDLDRFKNINDTLGHSFGDMVLVEVAKRVKRCLRPYDTMARLGGDEFVIILHQADVHTCEVVGKRILDVLALPFEREDMRFIVTCSIGVAMYPEDGTDMAELIKNADDAMYDVKEHGRGALRFYQRQMNVDLLARMKLDHAMREALTAGDFRLYYQPQVDIASGAVIGAEALIRWHHVELGDVSPVRFIPLAEETGFIVAIGDWVLTEAVRQAAQWYAQGLRIPISVNVSAPQFQQKNFVQKVSGILKHAALPAHMLELELTESILIGDAEEVLLLLRQLSELGVMLAIDDFGTGYSSLAYLKRFPIQRLKIDRSFVDNLPDDESDAAICLAVINVGHALKLKVIAEGVETERQRKFLEEAGCDEFQGWLRSPALPPDAFEILPGLCG